MRLCAAVMVVLLTASSAQALDIHRLVPKLGKLQAEAVCNGECTRGPDAFFAGTAVHPHCFAKCVHDFPERGGKGVAPPSTAVLPLGNNRAFILVQPMRYELGSTGVAIVVPAGFVTDFASIPRRLWSLYSPHDQYSRAAVIHDYLYWTQQCTRKQADKILLIAMKESEVPEYAQKAVYRGVDWFGQSTWEEIGAMRAAGLIRVVPAGRRDFPPNATWEQYRAHLVREGVRDPEFPKANYCHFGDLEDVPTQPGRANPSNLLPSEVVERMRHTPSLEPCSRGRVPLPHIRPCGAAAQ